MKTTLFSAIGIAVMTVACDAPPKMSALNAERSWPPAPVDLNPQVVDVGGQQVEVGFKNGLLRQNAEVSDFTISARPISVAQARTCLELGVCSASTAECSNEDGHDEDAALCVGVENARAYCEWSGGRLATIAEWLLAARGARPQRFAWGDEMPTCEHHPDAEPLEPSLNPRDTSETACGVPLRRRYRLGRHPLARAASGLEDVLLAPSELVGGSQESPYGPCQSDRPGCTLRGLLPGANDGVRPAADGAHQMEPYAFRCVWEAGEPS